MDRKLKVSGENDRDMSSTKKSGKRILPVILVILLAVMAGIGYWFLQSPYYALGMAAYGWHKKDWNIFSRYVDVRSLTRDAYERLAPYYTENKNRGMKDVVADIAAKIASEGEFGKIVAGDATEAVKNIDAVNERKMSREIQGKLDNFSFGNFQDQVRRLLDKGAWRIWKENFISVRQSATGKDAGMVELKLKNIAGEELLFKYQVEKNDRDDWQLKGIPNIDEILLEGNKFVF